MWRRILSNHKPNQHVPFSLSSSTNDTKNVLNVGRDSITIINNSIGHFILWNQILFESKNKINNNNKQQITESSSSDKNLIVLN